MPVSSTRMADSKDGDLPQPLQPLNQTVIIKPLSVLNSRSVSPYNHSADLPTHPHLGLL